MKTNPIIISYRSQIDDSSRFLNVEQLTQDENCQKIKNVYHDIFRSVTAYDPDHVENLVKIEHLLYSRIIHLELEKKESIQKGHSGWKSIVLSLLTLGIRTLIYRDRISQIDSRIKQMQKAHANFSLKLEQMRQRRLEKELHPKFEALKELEKIRLDDPEAELNRLKENPRIKKSLEEVHEQKKMHTRTAMTPRHYVALGRSLELQEHLKQSHYVINHGQNLNLMLVNILSRKLKHEFEPHYYESFEPLRHDSALRHIKEDTATVSWYQEQLGKMKDHYLRKELICGDCVLESTKLVESAIDFFSGRKNIAARSDPELDFKLMLSIAQDYIPDPKVASKLANDLATILERYPEGGNLYSICVPKEKFDECCFFTRPFGKRLKNQKELKEKMEAMQSGKEACGYPQIRILAHKIRPEDGYLVVLNSTFTTEQLQKIEEEALLCIQAALTGYRVKM